MTGEPATTVTTPLTDRTARRALLGILTRFLWLLSGALALGPVVRFAASPPSGSGGAASKPVRAGSPAAYPPGQARLVPGSAIWIGRDERGLWALVGRCTHLGCSLRQDGPSGWACACHGSRFDGKGLPVHGPASRPLIRVLLELDAGGELVAHPGRSVPMNWRLEV